MDDKPDALDKAWWKLCYDVMNDYACFPGAKEEAEKPAKKTTTKKTAPAKKTTKKEA